MANPIAPIHTAIRYTNKNFANDLARARGSFAGPPRPEVDQAWSNLLKGELL